MLRMFEKAPAASDAALISTDKTKQKYRPSENELEYKL